MGLPGEASALALSSCSIGFASYCLLQSYAQRDVGWLSFMTSVLGFVLSFTMVVLVPFDVWATALPAEDGQKRLECQSLAGTSWAAIYWVTSLLCWIVCPLLIEFEAAGDFTPVGRLRTSLRCNAAWCLVYVVAGFLMLVWFSVGGGPGLRAWCIAASNAWGLLLITALMGYGLVAVPRHFWGLADPRQRLRGLYIAAVAMDESRLRAQFELQDALSEARVELAGRAAQTWEHAVERALGMLQATVEECEQLHIEITNGARGACEGLQGACRVLPGSCDKGARLEALGEMHRSLKQSALEARRASCRWDGLVARCEALNDLEPRACPSAIQLAASWQGSPAHALLLWGPARRVTHGVTMFWFRSLRSSTYKALSVLAGTLSAVIVTGQLTMLSPSFSFSLLALPFGEPRGYWGTQVMCMLPLSYMAFTAYWSVFRLKVAGWYGLYGHNNTDTCSLLWCSSILARLAAPLCYHFLLLTRVKGTSLQQVMGEMSEVPILGGYFNQVFPVLVGFLCLCNLLNIYPRIVSLWDLPLLEADYVAASDVQDAGDLAAEGRRLVERERRRQTEYRGLLEAMEETGRSTVPLRMQVRALIEDGTLPTDWNAASPP